MRMPMPVMRMAEGGHANDVYYQAECADSQ